MIDIYFISCKEVFLKIDIRKENPNFVKNVEESNIIIAELSFIEVCRISFFFCLLEFINKDKRKESDRKNIDFVAESLHDPFVPRHLSFRFVVDQVEYGEKYGKNCYE